MKKYLTLLALVIFIIPSITFAVWWNPSTWFSRIDKMNFDYNRKMNEEANRKKTTDVTNNLVPTSTVSIPEIKTTFYVKYENTRLRKCASTDCEILGYYKVNDQIISTDSKPLTLKDMPEWIMFSLPDGETAYINKSVLSETSIVEQKNMHLSDLNIYIDTLISNYEELIKYVVEMKKSLEFYGTNFEKAKALAISTRDGGTLPSNLEEAMNLFIELYIDPAIKDNNTSKDYLKYYIDTETSLITELKKEKQNNAQSDLVNEQEYLYNYNKLKKKYGDNIDQHRIAFTDSFDKFIARTKKHQSEMLGVMSKMNKALDAYYLKQKSYYEDTAQNNSIYYYEPVSYPQIKMPKITYCNINGGIGGNYSIICN